MLTYCTGVSKNYVSACQQNDVIMKDNISAGQQSEISASLEGDACTCHPDDVSVRREAEPGAAPSADDAGQPAPSGRGEWDDVSDDVSDDAGQPVPGGRGEQDDVSDDVSDDAGQPAPSGRGEWDDVSDDVSDDAGQPVPGGRGEQDDVSDDVSDDAGQPAPGGRGVPRGLRGPRCVRAAIPRKPTGRLRTVEHKHPQQPFLGWPGGLLPLS